MSDKSSECAIAVRMLKSSNERNLEIGLLAPEKIDGGDWGCAYYLRYPDRVERGTALGIDAFQALTNAIQYIRTQVESSGIHYEWIGGTSLDGGFPRVLCELDSLGESFAAKVLSEIESSINARVDELKTTKIG